MLLLEKQTMNIIASVLMIQVVIIKLAEKTDLQKLSQTHIVVKIMTECLFSPYPITMSEIVYDALFSSLIALEIF